jgi:hypothetical protein
MGTGPFPCRVVPFDPCGVNIAGDMGEKMPVLKILGLNRDVIRNRAFVDITWEDDPEKRLGLPVPFDCQLDNLKAETEKAVKALVKELDYNDKRPALVVPFQIFGWSLLGL